MNYSELIQKLFEVNLFGGVKLGLDNCLLLDKALGYPSKSFKTIHVAGTNGKGSVTKKIAAALTFAGYRVGIYTSPHISSFRERICINGIMISEKAVEILLAQLFVLASKEKITPTFFEYTTLLALCYFAQEKVDFAVLETGLGGRLDATNIVIPELSIITSISLEHTEILGNAIEEIALEKAGIIKKGVPVLLGPRTPQSLLQTVAETLQSPCLKVSGEYIEYAEENQKIAQEALKWLAVPEDAIEAGLKASLPCRLELFTKERLGKPDAQPFPDSIVLDVAHNVDGLKSLFRSLKNRFPTKQFYVLFGLSKTKDIPGCLAIIKEYASHFHLIEATNGRGVSTKELLNALIQMRVSDEHIFQSSCIADSVPLAIKASGKRKEILIICGTFFIMGDVRRALGIVEPHDFIDMNERQIVGRK